MSKTAEYRNPLWYIFTTLVILASLAFVSVAISAERELSGQEITDLLPTIIAIGENATQTFGVGGSTTYTLGETASYGRWRIEGNRYCSVWPPAGDWSCYGVVHNSDTDDGRDQLIWVDGSGERIVNTTKLKE